MTHKDIGNASTARSCARGPVPFAPIVAALILAGCTVGPDFKKPAPPEVSGYSAEPLTKTESTDVPGGEAQTFTQGGEIAAFHDKKRRAFDVMQKAESGIRAVMSE